MKMDWDDGINLINKAIEKNREEKEWDMWVQLYPHMNKENFISFEKFRTKNVKEYVNKKQMTDKEILEQMEELRMIHQGNHPGIAREGVNNGII